MELKNVSKKFSKATRIFTICLDAKSHTSYNWLFQLPILFLYYI